MTTWLWRLAVGCELAWAALVAASLASTWNLSAAEALTAGLGAYILTQLVLVTTLFILAHGAAHELRACSVARTLWALCMESFHFGLAKLLMCADPYLSRRDVPAPADARIARPVLLIHGFACNRAVWRALIGVLRAARFAPIRAINLELLFSDLDSHTAGVERELRTMQQQCEGARVAIVAHSTGGLVARSALRSAGSSVISQIITLGSPHHGTAIACLSRLRPTQQMCPGSSWLRRLNAPADPRLARIAVTSLYSAEDELIAPAATAVLAGAESTLLPGLGHFALLRAARSIDRVLAALQCGGRV